MEIKGTISGVIYEAEDSLYKVLLVKTGKTETTVTGNFPIFDYYAMYSFEGEMVDTKYGMQFKASNFQKLDYDDKEGLILYLSSSNFSGIGKKTAEKIVDNLGIDCLNKIKSNPDLLLEVGIQKKKVAELTKSLKEFSDREDIFIQLYSYGLTQKAAGKLYAKYQTETLKKIQSNPYNLIHDIEGYGFLKADELAMKMGIPVESEMRIKEAIQFVLLEVCIQKGFTYLTKNQLVSTVEKLLNKKTQNLIDESKLDKCLDILAKTDVIIEKNDRYYPKSLYMNEIGSYERLLKINSTTFKKPNEEVVTSILEDVERDLGFSLTDLQRVAIEKTVTSKISIITGGPGTGKTTIVKALLLTEASLTKDNLDSETFIGRTLLLSPTGKAAKRLAKSCGISASTIHHALGYNEYGGFKKGFNDQLDETLIIIDEASMIDINLLYNLLCAVKDEAKLIFVGDVNQLPSVGPGNILQEMINSSLFSVTMLKEIMRQKMDSNIIKISQMVLCRNIDYSIFNQKKEVYFYQSDAVNVLNLIERFVKAYIDKGGDFKKDLQILVPMYKGVCGIDEINKMIQQKFNNNSFIYEKNNKGYKIGDKVLQLQNNPQLGIMNGDDGIILDYKKSDNNEILYINFNDRIVMYNVSDIDNLTLGYAISIHKSQGSEYENVIVPIVRSFYSMLKPKLIYTAFTRAKNKLILIGDPKTLNESLLLSDEARQTSLFDKEEEKPKIFIDDPEIPFEIFGEEDMENISPYDFMEN